MNFNKPSEKAETKFKKFIVCRKKASERPSPKLRKLSSINNKVVPCKSLSMFSQVPQSMGALQFLLLRKYGCIILQANKSGANLMNPKYYLYDMSTKQFVMNARKTDGKHYDFYTISIEFNQFTHDKTIGTLEASGVGQFTAMSYAHGKSEPIMVVSCGKFSEELLDSRKELRHISLQAALGQFESDGTQQVVSKEIVKDPKIAFKTIKKNLMYLRSSNKIVQAFKHDTDVDILPSFKNFQLRHQQASEEQNSTQKVVCEF